MATQTLVIARVDDVSGQARLELDVDDTSDPADWTLIAGRVVNGLARPCYVLVQRGSSQNWLEGEIAAGDTVEHSAGGPVQTMSDVPRMMLVSR